MPWIDRVQFAFPALLVDKVKAKPFSGLFQDLPCWKRDCENNVGIFCESCTEIVYFGVMLFFYDTAPRLLRVSILDITGTDAKA